MQTHIMPAPRAVGIFPSRAPLLETTTEKARFAAANTLASSKFYSFLSCLGAGNPMSSDIG